MTPTLLYARPILLHPMLGGTEARLGQEAAAPAASPRCASRSRRTFWAAMPWQAERFDCRGTTPTAHPPTTSVCLVRCCYGWPRARCLDYCSNRHHATRDVSAVPAIIDTFRRVCVRNPIIARLLYAISRDWQNREKNSTAFGGKGGYSIAI